MRRLLISHLLLIIILSNGAESQNLSSIKLPLINFLQKLSPENQRIAQAMGWNESTDPCRRSSWKGINCNSAGRTLRSITLDSLGLSGSIDAGLLFTICSSSSLTFLSLASNSLTGDLPPEIGSCTKLATLYLGNNSLSGTIPSSLPSLKNLKRLDISYNNFYGELPQNLTSISGLVSFRADGNHFTGKISHFDLNYFDQFNISFNQFYGPLPPNSEKFPLSSFQGNPGLCGTPLGVQCPDHLQSPSMDPSGNDSNSTKKLALKIITFLGYVLFGAAVILFAVFAYIRRRKGTEVSPLPSPQAEGEPSTGKKGLDSNSCEKGSRSEYSISSAPAAKAGKASPGSLVVLRRDRIRKELSFDDLLRAPAELMGKGRFGSLYRVILDEETDLAVKRIKDWTITGEQFQRKIMCLDQASHPNVLPVAAFYCSKQEKLVVYEFQKNGSLFKLLHKGQHLRWARRLDIAAGVSSGLAYMHETVEMGHGNLKSSNILFSSCADEPLISEYGLTALPTQRPESSNSTTTHFAPASDVHAFGIILLELLTGKPSQGFDLPRWVISIVKEEWTAEVFDKALLAQSDAHEDAMITLLQLALRCVDTSRRTTMPDIAAKIYRIKGYTSQSPSNLFNNSSLCIMRRSKAEK